MFVCVRARARTHIHAVRARVVVACGRVRQDFMWNHDTHCVILEVDEFQHKDRELRCELARVQDLVNAGMEWDASVPQ